MGRKIIIGSRGSDLALWQANFTKDQLTEAGHLVEIIIIRTKGDAIQHLSLDKIEGKGFFTKELEDALLDGSIDLAVHSHKDLPTTSPEGLLVAGVSYREDCSESLLIQPDAIDDLLPLHLKKGAIVGTSSFRRRSQLLHFRPDLEIRDIRGNVPTRVKKLEERKFDAIMLASAGLNRLNLEPEDIRREIVPPHVFIPAPAQGVLAYQVRENDLEMKDIIGKINDAQVSNTISVERIILNRLQGGCLLPLGAFCHAVHDDYHLWVSLKPDNEALKRLFIRGKSDDRNALADLALKKIQSTSEKTVYISRDPENADAFTRSLNAFGIRVIAQSPVAFETVEVGHIPMTDWVFFTSKRAVEHFLGQELMPAAVKIAAMGSGTDAALRANGIIPSFTGSDTDTRITANRFLSEMSANTVLFPVAEQGLRQVQKELENKIEVHEVTVYRSVSINLQEEIKADLFVFTSPSAVTAFSESQEIKGLKCIAIGKTTAKAIEKAGAEVLSIAPFTTLQALADTVCGIL